MILVDWQHGAVAFRAGIIVGVIGTYRHNFSSAHECPEIAMSNNAEVRFKTNLYFGVLARVIRLAS